MKNISLLVNTSKDFDIHDFKKKISRLKKSEDIEILLILYKKKKQVSFDDFTVFSVEDHEDLSFSQLLDAVKTSRFLFFNPEIDYPDDFFERLLNTEEDQAPREKLSVWKESLRGLQQSQYGLCTVKPEQNEAFDFLKESALYIKKEIETLNIDKLSVHPESATELYRYALKKKLNLISYTPKKKRLFYHTHFADLIMTCQKQAQKQFKLFPALFVLFFVIFGIGAAFNSSFFLIFLFGMSIYFLAITLESFGISTLKKNGAILPILLFLFPFVHLVYGLESWIAKLNKKN
ncbi:MAG: hypothetical protein JW857_08160 [Bacteroidales bacterium]|nr:hypothetical protein [Bacteroidales bacterium]